MTPTAAGCGSPSNPACDNYALSIVPPSYSFNVEITITAGPADDYDLEVYGPDGSAFGTSGNSAGAAEVVVLANPAAGTYTVSVANFAAVTAFNGVAEIVPADPGGPGPSLDGASFAVYPAPPGMGENSGEPSLGVNWNTDRVMYIAGLQTLQVEFDDCSSPAEAQWVDVSFVLTSTFTLDPILFTDPRTGRTFASQLGPKCSAMSFTDDDGANWTPSQGCGINAGVDHQSVGGGPFAPPLERDPEGPLYPNAVYYCSQDVAVAQCARSDTGGLTFAEATPIYNITECGGLHGHVKIAPDDGTAYVPNKNCNGEQAVVASSDNGLAGSWQVRRIPGTTAGAWDPAVGVGAEGTLYVGMTNGGRPMVSVSFDDGLTWSAPFDVGIGAGPNGADLLNTAFPVMVAGDDDRAAFGFLGAEQGGDGGGEDPNSGHVWYPYIAVTYDYGASWSITNVSPNDPAQRGTICNGGTLCGPTRNLLDFNDMSVDREGRVLMGYADGCTGACVADGGQTNYAEKATIARQLGGQRLFAAYDVVDVPAAPRARAEIIDEDNGTVLVSWEAPDDHGSPITEYRIYRRFEGGAGASQVGSVDGDTLSFEGTLPVDSPQAFYRVTAVTAFGEGPSCMWVSPTFGAPPANPCIEPGIEILTDPAGDSTDTLAEHDVLSLSVSQPTALMAPDLFIFTLKMSSLASPPASTTWPVVFNAPDGNTYFVKMATDLFGAVSFSSGLGANPSVAGTAADPGSGFDADGTIRIVVDRSNIGNPQIGEDLTGFLVRIRVELAAGSSLTPDNMPDGLAPTGSYSTSDCAAVVSCAQSAASDSALHAGHSYHAVWIPWINKNLHFTSGATFIEYPDGTARLIGTAVDPGSTNRRFVVDAAFSDYTDTPPPGSPKKELMSSAYVENGGPVDTSTWHYYGIMTATLTGEGDYDGALMRLYRRGAAFQVGEGANGKNARFGGSGWFIYNTEEQPVGGGFPSTGRGDFNLTLECD